MTTRRDPLSLLPYTLVPLVIAAALLLEPARAQDEAIDLFDPSIGACASAPDAAWYYQINGGSDERCQISDIRDPLPAVAFKTIDAPSGTDPVADAKDDTLTITCADGITCTGDSSTDTLALSASGVAPYSQYDPVKPPTTFHACTDEFSGGLEETWTGQNVGTSTFTAVLDGAHLSEGTAAGGVDRAVYWNQCTEPTDSFSVIVSGSLYMAGVGGFPSIALLESGTEATPTKIILCGVDDSTGSQYRWRFGTVTSYGSAVSEVAGTNVNSWNSSGAVIPFWTKLEYDDGADTVKCFGSADGVLWIQSEGAYTLTTDPTGLGISANGQTTYDARFEFFRVRTDANRSQASD